MPSRLGTWTYEEGGFHGWRPLLQLVGKLARATHSCRHVWCACRQGVSFRDAVGESPHHTSNLMSPAFPMKQPSSAPLVQFLDCDFEHREVSSGDLGTKKLPKGPFQSKKWAPKRPRPSFGAGPKGSELAGHRVCFSFTVEV